MLPEVERGRPEGGGLEVLGGDQGDLNVSLAPATDHGTQPTPYADAAMSYLQRGWSPIPLPPGQKVPPPKGWTGYGAPYPSGADVHEWASNGHGTGNVGLRMPETVTPRAPSCTHGGSSGPPATGPRR